MKVHVDADRCRGPRAVLRTAPELFEPDDIGNGHEIGDGTVAPELEHRARAGRRQLSRAGDHHHRGRAATDGPSRRRSPTGPPTSTTPTTSGPPTRTRSGTSSAGPAPSPTPTATAAPGCRPGTRTSPTIAYDTERFTSRSIVMSASSGRRSSWRRTASPRRSRPTRRSTRAPGGPAARCSRRRRSTSSSRRPAPTARS